jgi:hypothetical protein
MDAVDVARGAGSAVLTPPGSMTAAQFWAILQTWPIAQIISVYNIPA